MRPDDATTPPPPIDRFIGDIIEIRKRREIMAPGLLVNQCVRLDGLQARPELNGLHASCLAFNAETVRPISASPPPP